MTWSSCLRVFDFLLTGFVSCSYILLSPFACRSLEASMDLSLLADDSEKLSETFENR